MASEPQYKSRMQVFKNKGKDQDVSTIFEALTICFAITYLGESGSGGVLSNVEVIWIHMSEWLGFDSVEKIVF